MAEEENKTEGRPIKITIRPSAETPTQKAAREVAETVRPVVEENLRNSFKLEDYLLWHRALSSCYGSAIEWAWDGCGGFTVKSLLEDMTREALKEKALADAKVITELKEKIDQLPIKEGTVRVALKRVRSKVSQIYQYRVLAAFPKEANVCDSVSYPETTEGEKKEAFVFWDPINPCAEHACDDLYREHRKEPFYMPYRDLNTAIKLLQLQQDGLNEYMLSKTDDGQKITQDPENYILIALLGGYPNEMDHTRISDFWLRIKEEK